MGFRIFKAYYLLNSPVVTLDKDSKCAQVAPALCPPSVTSLGSPPKALAFFCTHRNNVTWSRRPLLPGILGVFNDRNPKTLSLELIYKYRTKYNKSNNLVNLTLTFILNYDEMKG